MADTEEQFQMHVRQLGDRMEDEASSESAAFDGYVRPIPEPLYPCVHCAEDYSWPATDLNWSEVDEGWVCDPCWDNRDSNWNGEDYIEKEKGISLAEEIKRQRT